MKAKLTKRTVDAASSAKKDFFIWDTDLPMFGLKVTPKGRKVYILQYRMNNRLRRYTIGKHGAWTPDQARLEAMKLLGQIASGVDPGLTKSSSKHGFTIKDLSDRYIREHAQPNKKPKSIKEDIRLLRDVLLPVIGHIQVGELNRTDVTRLHQGQRDAPYQANRVLALLSKMMNLAEKWSLRPDGSNPCRHVEKFKERKRERYLDTEELTRLGTVLTNATEQGSELPSVIMAIRLLILTGARLSEILELRWQYVDLERSMLVLPDSKTGFKIIPLGNAAMELLKNAPSMDGNPYVCWGQKPGSHLVGLPKAWGRIRKEAGIEDVRLHDLRHSFASYAAGKGMSLPMIGAILGHKEMSTTQRYSHLAIDPLKMAANEIADGIDAAMKNGQP